MDPPVGPSVLARLERAELAARERRLAAAAQAEGIVADARRRAAAIDAQTPDRVSAALEQLRRELLAQADLEIAAIEGEEPAGEATMGMGPDAGRSSDAVGLVVAAVLGEQAPPTVVPGAGAAVRPRRPPATGSAPCS